MTRRAPAGTSRFRLSAVVVLTAVWLLLWDEVSLFLLLTGVLLALLVGLVFPLPPIDLHGRFHPVAGLRLVARQLVDTVRASVDVVALAFRFGHTPHSSIVRVRLRSRSDLYLTQTAELVSLVPGSLVVEAHRATHTLYLHVLDAHGDGARAQAEQAVLDAEERILRTFGSAEEIAALDAGLPLPDDGTPDDGAFDDGGPEPTDSERGGR